MEKFNELMNVMERLRDPERGCPWDTKQTFTSIAPFTLEEAYEVADAIERADHGALCEELGDLLFQVVFLAQIAKDLELFGFGDVVDAITQKMIRRHPHVFGDTVFENEEQQKAHWESLKALERSEKYAAEPASALDGVAAALPALLRAEKIQKRASRVGMDWPNRQSVNNKLQEEMHELHDAMCGASAESVENEIGDVLFTVCNLARHANVDPEMALRRATGKFERRFRHVEQAAHSDGKELSALTPDSLDQYWQRAKRTESIKSE